jgi:fibro-slime domain-containing protein
MQRTARIASSPLRGRALSSSIRAALAGAEIYAVACSSLLALALGACSPGSSADGPVSVADANRPELGGAGGASSRPPEPGQTDQEILYEQPPAPGCGDFDKSTEEACDDGNQEDGDGCSANCLVVENGYTCSQPGAACVLVELCGDARLVGGETCDDGNDIAGDGCASNCRLEGGYACAEPGQPCISTVVCGDGFVAAGESCDDGNLTAGDGCSATCTLELGYQCLFPGAKCTPVCGDGLLTATEQCDDGNTLPGDGCAANCRLETGFACNDPGQACTPTDCLDGTKEGTEQCDDGNLVPYDGCSLTCVNEPRCGYVAGVYTCGAVCGDGMKFPEEACDDGNTRPGDGCSPDCQLEPGYRCTNDAAELGQVLPLPIIYRDFPSTHPQFEIDPLNSGRLANMVLAQLGTNGKPVYNPAFTFNGRPWTLDGAKPAANGNATLTSAAAIGAAFSQWYTDSTASQAFADILDLNVQDDDSFQFSATGANQFFPIDGRGFGNQNGFLDAQGVAHNFHFTSEVRQWFEFQGGETLSFSGDDDVWVFVNGQLTVDLGGIHSEIQGSISLSANGLGSTLTFNDDIGLATQTRLIDVPVSENVNEIAVFQAERHVTASNYTLTLRGFNAPVTNCVSNCGDGILTPDETCDEGALNGSGYNHCGANCTPGPRCGDGVVEAGVEQCDNGANLDGYLVSEQSCAPGCLTPARCGDGVIDGLFGELCDDGVNDDAYGGCSPECVLGPRCGDGVINGAETCDDGNRRNGDGCNVNCVLERDPR